MVEEAEVDQAEGSEASPEEDLVEVEEVSMPQIPTIFSSKRTLRLQRDI